MLIEGIEGLDQGTRPVIVVGSGPVGLALATALTRRGIAVTVLESGDKGQDSIIQSLSDATLTDPQRHDEMAVAVARRLGGTSNLWGARCLPYDPVDFRPRDYVDARWPIHYEDLAPYWSPALEATASGKPAFTADQPLLPDADPAFSMDQLERWANIQAAQNVHADAIQNDPLLEIRTLATVVDLDIGEDGRLRSLKVAHSTSGQTLDVPAQQVVIACGGLESTRLLLNAQRRNTGLFGGPEGPLGRYYMGHVMGEIADIRFSSPDIGRAFTFRVDENGSYVRRRIVASEETQLSHRLLNCALWPVVAPVANPAHHSAILSMVYLALAIGPIGRLVVAEAIRRRHIPDQPNHPLRHIRNVILGAPEAIAFAAQFFWRRYFRPQRLPGFFVLNSANRYGLFYHSEQQPQRDSRVWLTGETDALGLPRLQIDLRFSDADVDSVVRTHDLLEDWLEKSGTGTLHYRIPREERHASVHRQAAHGTHQCGLARMGSSRTDAVVDADLRCFDVPNLYLATTAVLPTSGQANPTLTTVALAIRLADHLAAQAAGRSVQANSAGGQAA